MSVLAAVCRARRVISNQLTQLATAPDSELTSALRGDLDQILASYTNFNPSSRNQALSMAVGHSSQRRTLYHSSRPADRPGNQTSAYGPYSTRSQSDYADRSSVLPVRDTRVQTAAAGQAPPAADEWTEYDYPTSRRPSYFPAEAGGRQSQGAGLSRATSNASAAGESLVDNCSYVVARLLMRTLLVGSLGKRHISRHRCPSAWEGTFLLKLPSC